MNAPASRKVTKQQIGELRELFAGRGHALRKNPKNRYIAFEVRTDGRSIFTLYTSGKLVSTVREGDAEGVALEADITAMAGAAPGRTPVLDAVPRAGLRWLGGADETGTGELLGAAYVGGALVPVEAVDAVAAVAGSVETKTSRSASGWESLGERLLGLGELGLVVRVLPVPNRLFDVYSKNALLDLAYVRLVADLLAGAGFGPDASLDDVELVVDDYGAGKLLGRARDAWTERGAAVVLKTKADVSHLSARTAAVFARATRAREMEGLSASVEDGPIGTGNAGHRDTLRWLRRRGRSSAPWPSFVKTSFRTVRDVDGLDPVRKRPMPALEKLLDDAAAAALLSGRLDVRTARLRCGRGDTTGRLALDPSGKRVEPEGDCVAAEFLPLLVGGLVLDVDDLSLAELDVMLDREEGLLSGWRVLTGPERDLGAPQLSALARAHRAGIVHLVATDEADPVRRARTWGALRLTVDPDVDDLHVRLVR